MWRDFLNISSVLNISNLTNEVIELEVAINNPDLFNNSEKAITLIKEYNQAKLKLDLYNICKNSFEDLQIMYDNKDSFSNEEIENQSLFLYNKLNQLNQIVIPEKDTDKLPAVIQIESGAGGIEAQDFAKMLRDMYFKYCFSKNYNI